jgi:hypothetical protein
MNHQAAKRTSGTSNSLWQICTLSALYCLILSAGIVWGINAGIQYGTYVGRLAENTPTIAALNLFRRGKQHEAISYLNWHLDRNVALFAESGQADGLVFRLLRSHKTLEVSLAIYSQFRTAVPLCDVEKAKIIAGLLKRFVSPSYASTENSKMKNQRGANTGQ